MFLIGLESPTEVEVQSVSTTDAKISWLAPPENFNCIEGYETTWSDGVNTNSATAPNKYTFTQVLRKFFTFNATFYLCLP